MNNSKLLSPGDRFEKYIIEKELGHGGMGAVYLVRHSILDTKFALKVLYPEVAGRDKQFVERFIREGRLAGQIRHENLIAVYDAGQNEKNGMYYLVMDFVSGGSVRDRIKQNHYVDMLEAISIIRQVACALQAAQNHNMVHRDIKPDNIMFDDKGVVRLADLGIAKATDDRETGLTLEASVFGTPAYMSPEQARDSSKVDTRADIYSLGVVFYEMLTGRRPFSGETTIEILSHVIDDTPAPDVRIFSKDLPADVAKLVADMLEKDRDKRVQSPSELIRRIDALDLTAYKVGEQTAADEVEVTMPTMASPVGGASASPVAEAPQPTNVTMPTMASAEPPPTNVTMPTMASPMASNASEASSPNPVQKLEIHRSSPHQAVPAASQPEPTLEPTPSLANQPEASVGVPDNATMAMPNPPPQPGMSGSKAGKGGLALIFVMIGLVLFLFIGGAGTVLFLKRDAIMALFDRTKGTQTSETETIPPAGTPQASEKHPEVVKSDIAETSSPQKDKPPVNMTPEETTKPPVASTQIQVDSTPKTTDLPTTSPAATTPELQTAESGLLEETAKPTTATTVNADKPDDTHANVPIWKRFTQGAQQFGKGAQQFGKQVAKDTKEFGQQVVQQVAPSAHPAEHPPRPNEQSSQANAQQSSQPVTQSVVQSQETAADVRAGLQKLGFFADGGVVLFGANDGRNTSFFRELSKYDVFKAVGFQEASKDVRKWNSQLNEIQSNGPAFVIVVLSEEKNDYNFKKMLQGLVKVLPSSNAVILVASGNPAVFDEVKDTCNSVGMYFRKWGSNKELANYVLELKKELGW